MNERCRERNSERTLTSSWDTPVPRGPALCERAAEVLEEFMDGADDPRSAETSVLQDSTWQRLVVSLDGRLQINPLLGWASPTEREKSELESAAAATVGHGFPPGAVASGALFDALSSLQFYVDFLGADHLLTQSET